MLRNKDVILSIESVFIVFPILSSSNIFRGSRLLKCLFPLLPRTSSSALRSYIRKTILSEIRIANIRTQNHKLNRAVQAMLFNMAERGRTGEVLGDKGKPRALNGQTDGHDTEEAMWAVVLTKELWRKGVWYILILPIFLYNLILILRHDAKSVSIIVQGCFHPVTKVQSASLHFFLGSEEGEDEDEDDNNDVCFVFHLCV